MDHPVDSSSSSGDQEPGSKPVDVFSHENSASESKSRKTKVSLKKKFFGTRNKKMVVAGSTLVLLLLGSFGWRLLTDKDISLPTNVTNEVPMLGAAVSVLDGTAKISSDGQTWETLTTDSTIETGDSISTDPASRVIITLDDGSAVRLDESTTAKIESLDAEDIRIANQAGNVYSRVVTSDRKYTVEVEGTDYTALGTAFNTVNEETDKGVQVLQSSVAVEGEEDKVEEGRQFFDENANGELKDKITDISVDELKSSGFMIWNLEHDEKDEKFKDKLGYLQKIKEPAAEPAPQSSGASIKLTAKTNDKGIALSWTLSNVTAPDGFKVVRSKKSTTPTYGKDEASYVGSKDRSLVWKTGDGITYTYRVCVYEPENKTCSNYSNAVTVASPVIEPEKPVSGTVTLVLSGNTASWTSTGTAPHGFKVNISASHNPTYGADNTRSYFTASPYEINTDELQIKLGAGPYYVRVCKYTASSYEGGCMDYSNEETLVIP